ncbi:MAG: hypothetical protein JOZ43_07085 [Acidobacteriales bacterium]|nr:hypothetical protein [Terriglobales bacterium]
MTIRLKLFLLLLSVALGAQTADKRGPINEQTALALGEKQLVRTFGRRSIDSNHVVSARLDGDNWIVSSVDRPCVSRPCTGGGVVVKLRARDGRVMKVEGFK